MADMDGRSEHKEFHADVPQVSEGFFLKGSAHYDWGLKNRLARIFDPTSGRTVMLAFDHGYFQGPTTGLERIDLSIVPLIPYADTLMLTRCTRFCRSRRSMIPVMADPPPISRTLSPVAAPSTCSAAKTPTRQPLR